MFPAAHADVCASIPASFLAIRVHDVHGAHADVHCAHGPHGVHGTHFVINLQSTRPPVGEALTWFSTVHTFSHYDLDPCPPPITGHALF